MFVFLTHGGGGSSRGNAELGSCLDFFFTFAQKFFNWLNSSFILSGTVTFLGVLIAFFITYYLIDRFIAK